MNFSILEKKSESSNSLEATKAVYLAGLAVVLWESTTSWRDILFSDWKSLHEKVWVEFVHIDTKPDEYDLPMSAISSVLEKSDISMDKITWIVVSTSNTFQESMPRIDHMLVAKLWMNSDVYRNQVWSGCVWWVEALKHAYTEMMNQRYKTWKDQYFLVAVADRRSNNKPKDWSHDTMPMLSDATWAVILTTKRDSWMGYVISEPMMFYWDYKPEQLQCITTSNWVISMNDGSAVFKFATKTWVQIFDSLSSWGKTNYVIHSANMRITQNIQKTLIENYPNLDIRVEWDAIKHGNMWWSSIFYWIKNILENPEIQEKWMVVWAFGADLSAWWFRIEKQSDITGLWNTLSSIDETLIWECHYYACNISGEDIRRFIYLSGDANFHYNVDEEDMPVPGLIQLSMFWWVIHDTLKVNDAELILRWVDNVKYKNKLIAWECYVDLTVKNIKDLWTTWKVITFDVIIKQWSVACTIFKSEVYCKPR